MGVWIETRTTSLSATRLTSHTLRGCVDWNFDLDADVEAALRHTLRGCVDWNGIAAEIERDMISHTLRGCVDWNLRTWTSWRTP